MRQSIKEYGFLQPVVVNTHQCERCGDRRNVIVGGHRRIEAAQAEGLTEVPAVFVNLHIEDEKRANLRLNAQEKFDKKSLADLITELHNLDAAKTATLGFDTNEIIRLLFELYNEIIYVQMLATAPHRAERNMRKRKVVKTHQNLYTFYRGDHSLLRNPQLLEVHHKVLGFFKGDPEKIKEDFKNPPPIQHNIIDSLLELE